jgi:hypothetical protein
VGQTFGYAAIQELGSTGILIYLVVKEAMRFVGEKRNGKSSGDLDPAQWRETIDGIMEKHTNRILEAIKEIRRRRSP